MTALTWQDCITFPDGRAYRVYGHDNLARVDTGSYGRGATIARFFCRPGVGWVHRETETHSRSALDLALRLLREGAIR